MVQSSETERADGATARAAGRGGLAIAGAKVAFILFGFAQQLILPRLVGVDGYGQVALVLSVVSILNNVIVATSIQGVSRAVSSAPAGREDQAFRATLRVHVALAMVVSLVFALAHLTNYSQVAVLILLPLVVPQLLFGLILGYARVTYGLWSDMLLHMMHNGLLIGLVVLQKGIGG